MSVLEKNVTALPSLPPSLVPTACVIDAMALIQVMKSATSATFGEIEEQYLFCFGLLCFVLFLLLLLLSSSLLFVCIHILFVLLFLVFSLFVISYVCFCLVLFCLHVKLY